MKNGSPYAGFHDGFTLVELLVSMAVLALLMMVVAQMFSSATIITTGGNKHMDADAQARPMLDRMAIDFSKMVKRKDVDYFLKQPGNTQPGNDQIAFFSEVTGYSSATPSPVSLVAYRVNADPTSQAYDKVERLGKGLLWNGASAAETPLVYLPLTIAGTWPAAASGTDTEGDYELIGPQVFRLEYFYLLRGQAGTAGNPAVLSDTPWDTRAPLNHTSVNGLQDVAAIVMTIAVLDPKSRVVLSDPASRLAALAGEMKNFDPATMTTPGALMTQWQAAADASDLPRPAKSAMRFYQRYFYLDSPPR